METKAKRRSPVWLSAAVAVFLASCGSCGVCLAQPSAGGATRELDTRRLLGKAYYENGDYASAAEEYRRAIELAPDSAADCFNLGLVEMRASHFDEALALLRKAEKLDPERLEPYYVRGILHRRRFEFGDAIEALEHVVARDSQCAGCYYNLGFSYKLVKKYDKAITAFQRAVDLDPDRPSSHYQLITLYRRVGDVNAAERHAEIYDRIKDTIDESEKTAEALERSKYSNIVYVRPEGGGLSASVLSNVRFVDTTEKSGLTARKGDPRLAEPLPSRIKRSDYREGELPRRYVAAAGGSVALGDGDGDGDLDIYLVQCAMSPEASANRLFRNEGQGRFRDVTAAAGVGHRGMGLDAVFGDFDNDQDFDLYVVNWGPNALYRNRGDGSFEDVSKFAGIDEPQFGRSAVFFDYDHDYDLDIFVVNDVALGEPPERDSFRLPEDFPGQFNTLLRNNGNGTFSDQTDEAGLLVDCSQSRGAVFADFDGDSDVDLFVGNADTPSTMFKNARFGRLRPGGSFSPAIEGGVRAMVVSDINRDGATDLLVAVGDSLIWYQNQNNSGSFQGAPVTLPQALAGKGVGQLALMDHNNDGLEDLLVTDPAGGSLSLLAGLGSGRFSDVSSAVGVDKVGGGIAGLAVGDVDGDGDADIVLATRERGAVLLSNEGGNENHWLTVQLVGKKVNRCGYGATVEIATGSHYQKQTASGEQIHFGLGDLDRIDVVRVTWPNGVAQNLIRPAVNRSLTIEEHVRVSASCAFLWADGGDGYELVNEILGVAPLGVPISPGVYHQPDSNELTTIESHQLCPRDGIYELRLTEDLREIMYADRFTLRIIDHRAELEVVPNEMFTAPPFPGDKFFALGDCRPPRAAVDDRGVDVLDLVSRRDGRFPTFARAEYDGVAEPHSLTLDLGNLAGAKQILLCLDSWVYWPDSSTVVAIAQDPRLGITPLTLDVQDESGNWRTAIESAGLPTSKGTVVPLDLTGRFLCNDYRVRLSTNLCVYFDRIFVSTRDAAHSCPVTELPVASADLSYRGFAAMTRDEHGYERFDYSRLSSSGAWSPPRGMLTRYGDVTPLLAEDDDMYVILGPGDELSLQFDATDVPNLPTGWTRTFVFYASGWVKDGDLNTAHSETVSPLPFHAMSAYPYSASERYPETAAHRRYLRTYNTRPARSTVGRLTPVR